MVNIGIEALFSDTPRTVLFISLEESQKQILRRFSLCLAYRNAKDDTKEQLLSVTNPYTDKKDPKNAYKNWKRKREIGGDGAKTFIKAITKSENAIKDKVKTGELVFFDGIGAPLHEITAAIRGRKQGDVVLVDYIQKIPAMGKTYSGNPDLERIRDGSQRLIEAAKSAECVIIAGAQFKRDNSKGQKSDDEFTDDDFRGCGDLEQDGHNLIGIGRSADKTKTYYGVIKSREGEVTDTLYTLDFAGGYSFMARGTGEYTPQQKPKKGRNNKNPPARDWTQPPDDDDIEAI
jgi:hypothetical protein